MKQGNGAFWFSKRGNSFIAAVFICLLAVMIAGCQTKPKEVNRFPPYQSKGISQQSNQQARQRYITADLQLAGAFDAQKDAVAINSTNPVYQYYSSYSSNDVDVNNGLQNFISGDLVINIYQFDRVYLANDGWQVVYGGTEFIVNGDDFVMASDIGGLNNEEARIRYILADIQLGDVAGYYRQYLDQPAVAEAIRRWDAGVRVANIAQFERKVVAQAGWKVVYIGSDSTVLGSDILLTTDQAPEPQPTAQAAIEPTSADSCSSGETRINYILADIQLGGVDAYYRQITDDPSVVEAVRRWDSGVRLADPGAFERKIVGDQGWQIVYAGTEQRVDCNDIQLGASVEICGNIFWPIKLGAYWEYVDSETGQATRKTIVSVQQAETSGRFTIQDEQGYQAEYNCAGGEIRDSGNQLILPADYAFTPNNQVTDFVSGGTYLLSGPTDYTSPMGTFGGSYSVAPIGSDCFNMFSQYVGLVASGCQGGMVEITNYYIP